MVLRWIFFLFRCCCLCCWCRLLLLSLSFYVYIWNRREMHREHSSYAPLHDLMCVCGWCSCFVSFACKWTTHHFWKIHTPLSLSLSPYTLFHCRMAKSGRSTKQYLHNLSNEPNNSSTRLKNKANKNKNKERKKIAINIDSKERHRRVYTNNDGKA